MKIVLTGGGTGGHIYPGLTLWHYILRKHPDAQVLYIGTERGLERDIVGHEGVEFKSIHAAGLKRQLSLSALSTAAVTYAGYWEAKRILKKFRPDVVVGTGGYVTLPVIFAASAKNIPSVIWEANARPGLTNQLCAKRAAAIAISFPDTEHFFKGARKIVLTGNPRASEVQSVTQEDIDQARVRYNIGKDQKLIISFMGSRGAETVNEVLVKMIPRFEARPDWKYLYVTGDKHYKVITGSVGRVPPNVQILPFIHDMPHVLPLADVLVARAGGATLAEICSLGISSILIPSPYVTANHQEENAKRLVSRKAAKMIREADLTSERLWRALEGLLNGGEATEMRLAAKALGTPNAVEQLYNLVISVMT